MSWLKTRPEGEAQGESGGRQSPPITGAAWRGTVPHYRQKSLMLEAWLHAGRVIPAEKLASTAAAEVLRREHGHGKRVWWEADATHSWHRGCCDTPSSEISDGGGVAVRREGDISAEKLASTASAEVLRRKHGRGQEFGGRLTQPTPGAAAMLCHYRQNALTAVAGAGRVRFSRQC